jgi:hypothetical protein
MKSEGPIKSKFVQETVIRQIQKLLTNKEAKDWAKLEEARFLKEIYFPEQAKNLSFGFISLKIRFLREIFATFVLGNIHSNIPFEQSWQIFALINLIFKEINPKLRLRRNTL